MKKTREELMFEIEQYKSTSVVHSLEATALTILSLLVFIGAPSVFPTLINPYDPNSLKILQGVIILPFAYFIFVLIGNLIRLYKIQKLKKQLYPKTKKK